MRYAVGRWAAERWDRDSNRIVAVAGRSTTDSGAQVNDFSCNLWNPSGTISLWVVEFSWESPAWNSPISLALFRTSTTGTTPTTTVTPDLDNDFEREFAPQTGAVLYLGPFATDPVQVLPYVDRVRFHAFAIPQSARLRYPGRGLRVPPGSGLGLSQNTTAAIQAADHGFWFWE